MLTILILLLALLSILWLRQRAAGEPGHEGAALDYFAPGRPTRFAVSTRRGFRPLVLLLVSPRGQESSLVMRRRFREMRLRQIPPTAYRLAWMAQGLPRPDTRPGLSAQ